jgi:NADH pyrophosphatase NudC (nudix superfamily)
MYDELLDLVDKSGNIIATMNRSEVFAQGLKNFRLVCALIKNDQGKIFIPRRAANKRDFPNALACVGGCVISGETYDEGLKREVLEEVMLDISKIPYTFLGYISPFEHNVNGYVAAYEIQIPSSELSFEKNDFSEAMWLTPSEVKERIKHGDIATKNLLALLELYYNK